MFTAFWFVAVIRVKSCCFPAVTVVGRTDKSNVFYEYLKEEAENPPLICQIYFHYRNARGKGMITVLSTEIFDNRIDALKDIRAKTKTQVRIRRLKNGNCGDIEPAGEGFSEMRIHEGKGYRVYLRKHGKLMVILLCGGDKSTQQKLFTKRLRGNNEAERIRYCGTFAQ